MSFPRYYYSLTIALLLSACNQPLIISPDAILPDGSEYEGDLESGKLHGHGTLIYPSKAYYKGQFLNGVFQGNGEFVYSTGEKYEGQFDHGEIHGFGKLTDAKENIYEGEFVSGVYHGKGTHTLKSGAVYEGDFVNGLYEGKGRYSRNEYFYQGDFVGGVFTGKGTYLDFEGNEYNGEVKDWLANGKGEKTSSEGTTIKGLFIAGYADGEGIIVKSDGDRYEGLLSYDRPEGHGQMVYSNGDVFEGEFSYGKRFGIGTLTRAVVPENESKTLTGKWNGDVLTHNFETGERRHDQSSLALENHQENLETEISKLKSGLNSQTDTYFLGVAGDGSQSVFRREIEYVAPLIEARYSTSGRSIALINDHDTAAHYALATRRSIKAALDGIADRMDKEEDILFVYLTSHGSKDHEFYLNHDSIKLSDLSAVEFSQTLKETQIKWKVIIISACYAGGFISELEDDYTLIITAADAESRSFGCSDESEMTDFGRALFKESMAKNTEASLPDAFKRARELVLEWETDQEKEPSNPMIHAPKPIVSKLRQLENSSSL